MTHCIKIPGKAPVIDPISSISCETYEIMSGGTIARSGNKRRSTTTGILTSFFVIPFMVNKVAAFMFFLSIIAPTGNALQSVRMGRRTRTLPIASLQSKEPLASGLKKVSMLSTSISS
uniref:Uncharacterized protein n=1 Tax=Amphimedon queenslandica TaxID=400682 RepID=A0A1X7VSP0_AMPQE